MTRLCTVCTHQQRALVEDELARGVPLRTISTTYRISYSALRRHNADHMIVVDRENGAKEVMRLQDAIDIPLQSKERAQLINALLDRALEPLTRRGKGSGLNAAPTGFILNLLRLQSTDEQVILKQLGLLGGNNRKGGSNDRYGPMDADTFNELKATVEVALKQYEEDHPREGHPPTPASRAGQVPIQPEDTTDATDYTDYEGEE